MILAAWEGDGQGLAAGWAKALGYARIDSGTRPHVVLAIGDSPGHTRLDDRELLIAAEGVAAADVASAYRREGTGCSVRLSGAFAVVIYDSLRRRLFATSAVTSHLQLAYWTDGKTTLAASGVLDLLRHPATPRALDEVHLAHIVFGLLAMQPGSTPIAGVRRLRAGEGLLVEEGGQTRVIQVDRLRAKPRAARRAARIAAFWEQFETIAQHEMRAERGTCLSLSGGLDSTTLAVAMTRGERTVDAFAMVAPELGGHDEARSLDVLESIWPRMRLRRVDCSDEHEYPNFDHLPLRQDPLLVPLSLLPSRLRLWSAAHCAGFGAVLDGEGGDELFGALASPLDALLGGRWLTLARHLRSRPDRRSVVRRSLLFPLLGARVTNALRSKLPTPDALLPAFASWRAAEHGPVHIALQQRIWAASVGSRRALVHAWLSSPLHVGSALSHDHLAAASGIRRSSPFLRRDIVELVLGLRPGDMLSTGQDKPFLRAALAGRVPEGVRNASKDVLMADTFSSRIVSSARARSLLADARVRDRLADWVRFEKVDAMVDAAGAGRLRSTTALLALESLVSFADWYARASREYGVV